MGHYPGKEKSIMDVFMSICEKAGIAVTVLQDINGTCCGQIFSSKGFSDAYRYTANKLMAQLWASSAEGVYPIVMDVSSCTFTLKKMRYALTEENQRRYEKLRILDSVDFLHDMVIPSAEVRFMKEEVILHPVCSLEKMKTTDKFFKVARHFARAVTIPKHAGCCGMAGDRGFLFPELTSSATHHEASEVRENQYDGYYSTTRTCEMAMSEAVRRNYESVLFLVDEGI